MSMLTTRTVSLSVALLLASTSLSQAGFVWLSPDRSNTDNTVFSQQAAPAAPAEIQQGRSWDVEPTVPVVGAQAPAPLASDTTPIVPIQLTETAPVTVTAPVPVFGGDTLSSQPIYAPGDQAPSPVAQASMTPTPIEQPAAAPVEMMYAAPAQVVTAPAPASAETEVTLATTRGDLPLPTPAAQQGHAASAAMPSAEAMISGMPSMTAPRVTAPVAPVVAPAPVAVTEAPMVDAPVQLAAPAETSVVPMLSPATVPMQASTSPTPAASTVSMVTGQPIAVTSVVAPAVDTAKVIDGFGKHVPLVIAMRQILPSGYGFAHGSGVDLTAAIDWQGGRPWPQVLAEAISPIGLTASVMGDTVMIEKLGSGPAPVQLGSADAPAVTPSSAPLAPGQAVLTNATVMQAPPSNN